MRTLILTFTLLLISAQSFAAFTSPHADIGEPALKIHPIGETSSKTAILLGGGPGFTSWNLEPIQNTLVELNWQVYLWDMRGLGENSALSAANSIDDWIKDIESVRQHSGKNTVTLIGHSWGALMAMLYAREHSEHVERIILLNPVDPEKSSMQALTEAIHKRNLEELQQNWDDDSAWDNAIETQPDEERIAEMTRKQITQVLPTYFMDYKMGQKYAEQFSVADFNIDLNINTWKAYDQNPVTFAQIQQWKFPIDFVECQQDPLMPYNLNAMKPHIEFNSLHIMEQCGHFPWIEQPKAFRNVLQSLTEETHKESK